MKTAEIALREIPIQQSNEGLNGESNDEKEGILEAVTRDSLKSPTQSIIHNYHPLSQ